jgi:hypothetical protein
MAGERFSKEYPQLGQPLVTLAKAGMSGWGLAANKHICIVRRLNEMICKQMRGRPAAA